MAGEVTHPFNPRQLPFVGNQIAKIGQVYDTLSSDCQTDAVVWFQAAFHAAPYLLLSLTLPECFDIDLPRGGRRHKRLRRFGFRWTQILQPTIVIRGLPGYARFAFNTLELAGWYMLLADATLDFAVNWTSMAYQWSGCQVPNNPYGWGANGFMVMRHGVWFYPTLDANGSNNAGIYVNVNGIVLDPGVNGAFEYYGTTGRDPYSPGHYNTTSVTFELIHTTTGTVIERQKYEQDQFGQLKWGGFTKQWPFLAPGGQYRLRVLPEGPTTFGTMYGYRFACFARNTSGLVPSAPDCNPFNN